MSMRRAGTSSEKPTTRNQDEIRNGCPRVEQKKPRLSVCVFCISFVLVAPLFASSQDKNQCLPHCWSKVSQDVSFSNGVHLETIAEEDDCKDVCFNNETCIGVFWGFDASLLNISCWLQMPFSGTTASLRNANHWNVTACSDDCVPNCWLPKWVNVRTMGGQYHKDVDTEVRCKSLCSRDEKCTGIDFDDSEPSCYLLFSSEITRTGINKPIHHWEIIRNLPDDCLKEQHHGALAVVKVPVVGEIKTGPTSSLSKSKGAASNETEKVFLIEKSKSEFVNESPNLAEFNATLLHCPNYLPGIVATTVLMGICCLMVISLIAYIIYLHHEQTRLLQLLALRNDLYGGGYQSLRTSEDVRPMMSESETVTLLD